jgi:predicted YcjX-like family ATPase
VRWSDLAIAPLDALRSTRDYLSDLTTPTLRLGVTGLARAGKTVFITSMVRNLTQGGRLPFLSAFAEGRVISAHLEPQPDDNVPRFDYERHVAALTGSPPAWPESTRAISELRVTITYRPRQWLAQKLGPRKLHIDIVDYPGEWLLDLPMLGLTYAQWSAEAMALARAPSRKPAAMAWLAHSASLEPQSPADEAAAIRAAEAFTTYLRSSRADEPALSTVGPGRFLMPGEYEGSPLLAFAPLDIAADAAIERGSLAAMMARRYESYRAHIVRPFFRDHFSRLDRQIVLVDALSALNRGAHAVDDLSRALEAALVAFRPGSRGWLAALLPARIDRIVFAATKADHLPQSSHDRLEATLGLIVQGAARRAETAGADIRALALAALRATTEARARHNGEMLACIKGTPLPGERMGDRVFDGTSEIALFPGDLDADPRAAIAQARASADAGTLPDTLGLGVVKFRPPVLPPDDEAIEPRPWPHVRLDKALEHLLGDRLA